MFPLHSGYPGRSCFLPQLTATRAVAERVSRGPKPQQTTDVRTFKCTVLTLHLSRSLPATAHPAERPLHTDFHELYYLHWANSKTRPPREQRFLLFIYFYFCSLGSSSPFSLGRVCVVGSGDRRWCGSHCVQTQRQNMVVNPPALVGANLQTALGSSVSSDSGCWPRREWPAK